MFRPVSFRLLVFGLGLSLATAVVQPALAADIVWVYPPPNSLLTESPVPLLGYLAGAPRRILYAEITNPEASPSRQMVKLSLREGRIFSEALQLAPGRSDIRVAGSTMSLLYRPGFEGESEGDFRRPHAHPEMTESCADCHAFRDGLLVPREGIPQLCLSCHDQWLRPEDGDRAGAHAEEILPDCLVCHDAHASFQPALLRTSAPDLCGSCHDARMETHGTTGAAGCAGCHDPHTPGGRDGGPDFATMCGSCHAEPMAQGHGEDLAECSACHTVHGKPRTGLLSRDMAEACAECHEDVTVGALVHPALDEGCEACHQPHKDRDRARVRRLCGECHDLRPGSELASLHGRIAVSADSCVLCHRPHASEEKALLRAPVHFPLGQGKCDSCHEPNGKVEAATLAQKCDICHPFRRNLEGRGVPLHDPVAEGDCVACHDPHLASRRALLTDEETGVCGECHDLPEEGEGRQRHSALESCSDCHAVHGGEQDHFLRVESSALCLECHDDPAAAGGDLHPALDEGCGACHDPHGGHAPGNLHGKQVELCLECHDDPAADAKVPHGAVAEGCSGCHEPHAGEARALLRAEGVELCLRCHPVTGAPDGGMVVHDPADDCSNCHEAVAHGGETGSFLQTPPPELCLDCHDDPAAEEGDLHPALDEGCLVCHDPHASANAGLLLGATAEAACLECHDDPRAGGGEVHPALDEGCTACHRPHVSPVRSLLRGASPRRVCLECHDDPAEGLPVRHAGLEEGCDACHAPHASPNAHLLQKPRNEVCRKCHSTTSHRHSLDAAKGTRRFPASEGFPVHGGEFACTGCHLPHGSQHQKLYVRPADKLCQECHHL